MIKKDWSKEELYIRCKVCGIGKPRSEYDNGSHRICKSCRKNKNV